MNSQQFILPGMPCPKTAADELREAGNALNAASDALNYMDSLRVFACNMLKEHGIDVPLKLRLPVSSPDPQTAPYVARVAAVKALTAADQWARDAKKAQP